MNTRLITATVAVVAAIAAGQAFAADEANQFNPNAITVGAVSRAQVQAELAQAVRNGTLVQDVETGNSQVVAAPAPSTDTTRAAVKAEAVQAARAHQLPLADQTF